MQPCRDFAQPSILSLFSSSSSSSSSHLGTSASAPRTPSVSLLEFLDKRLAKQTVKKQQYHEETIIEPVEICSNFIDRASDNLKIQRSSLNMPQQHSSRISGNTTSKLHASIDAKVEKHLMACVPQNKSTNDQSSEDLQHSPTQFSNLHTRGSPCHPSKKSFKRTREERSCRKLQQKKSRRGSTKGAGFGVQVGSYLTTHLLVLGDDPTTHKKRRRRGCVRVQNPSIFNHYADGRGLWDTDMVGLDSEGVGSVGVWEGVGTMSLGTSGPSA